VRHPDDTRRFAQREPVGAAALDQLQGGIDEGLPQIAVMVLVGRAATELAPRRTRQLRC
jgi:hypothetical protein